MKTSIFNPSPSSLFFLSGVFSGISLGIFINNSTTNYSDDSLSVRFQEALEVISDEFDNDDFIIHVDHDPASQGLHYKAIRLGADDAVPIKDRILMGPSANIE